MILNMIKGVLIGIALIVPGLSGSIFAIILGLYDKALRAVADFRQTPKETLKFLSPIGAGAVLGILGSAGIVVSLTEQFPTFTYLFFAGLVIGSMPLITVRTYQKSFKAHYLLGTLLAFVGVILLTNASPSENHISMYRIEGLMDVIELLIGGAVTASLMVVPGVSGSVIIIVLGLFGTIYHAIGQTLVFLQYFVTGNFDEAWVIFGTVAILIPFALGAILGLVSIAKLMTWLLTRFEVAVYYCVGGALLATVWVLGQMALGGNVPDGGFLYDMVFAILSVLFVLLGIVGTWYLATLEKK